MGQMTGTPYSFLKTYNSSNEFLTYSGTGTNNNVSLATFNTAGKYVDRNIQASINVNYIKSSGSANTVYIASDSSGKFETFGNVTTLTNAHTITSLTNNSSKIITAFNNNGEVTTFNNSGTTTIIAKSGATTKIKGQSSGSSYPFTHDDGYLYLNNTGGTTNTLNISGGTTNNLNISGGTTNNITVTGGTTNNIKATNSSYPLTSNGICYIKSSSNSSTYAFTHATGNLYLNSSIGTNTFNISGGTTNTLNISGGTTNTLNISGGTTNNIVVTGGTTNNIKATNSSYPLIANGDVYIHSQDVNSKRIIADGNTYIFSKDTNSIFQSCNNNTYISSYSTYPFTASGDVYIKSPNNTVSTNCFIAKNDSSVYTYIKSGGSNGIFRVSGDNIAYISSGTTDSVTGQYISIGATHIKSIPSGSTESTSNTFYNKYFKCNEGIAYIWSSGSGGIFRPGNNGYTFLGNIGPLTGDDSPTNKNSVFIAQEEFVPIASRVSSNDTAYPFRPKNNMYTYLEIPSSATSQLGVYALGGNTNTFNINGGTNNNIKLQVSAKQYVSSNGIATIYSDESFTKPCGKLRRYGVNSSIFQSYSTSTGSLHVYGYLSSTAVNKMPSSWGYQTNKLYDWSILENGVMRFTEITPSTSYQIAYGVVLIKPTSGSGSGSGGGNTGTLYTYNTGVRYGSSGVVAAVSADSYGVHLIANGVSANDCATVYTLTASNNTQGSYYLITSGVSYTTIAHSSHASNPFDYAYIYLINGAWTQG